jgi:hypothetical protein
MTSHEANGPDHPGSAMPPATTTRLEQDDRVRAPRDTRSDSDKSAAELEREVERERAELTWTINEIRRSLSPGQLLDQALDYAKHSGGREFAETVMATASLDPAALDVRVAPSVPPSALLVGLSPEADPPPPRGA